MTALLREGGRPLWIVLGIALLARIAIAFWPILHHADEVWQYLEPARHLTSGPWIETWEFRGGARSWFLPLLFAGPMALGHLLPEGLVPDMLFPRLLCAMLALGTVAGAAGLGFRLSRLHGLIAAFTACIWYELVYFGGRTLSEPIAVSLFVLAAWLLHFGGRKLILAGLLLALCCVVRFQYAPAVLALAAVALRLDLRGWLALVKGGLAGLAIGALADVATGDIPYAWIVRNLTENLVENRSAGFGTEPFYWYLVAMWKLWPVVLLPMVALAVLGARRYPALLAAALVNLAVHMAIPHKEYRFILLTTSLLVLLASIGSVDLMQRWRRMRQPALALGTGWLAVSALCAGVGEAGGGRWGENRGLVKAWRAAAGVPDACGIAIYRMDPLIASHALFGRDAPIYQYGGAQAGAARSSRAFNLVLTPFDRGPELPGYRLVGCSDGNRRYCLYRRPGPCAPGAADAPFEANSVLRAGNF